MFFNFFLFVHDFIKIYSMRAGLLGDDQTLAHLLLYDGPSSYIIFFNDFYEFSLYIRQITTMFFDRTTSNIFSWNLNILYFRNVCSRIFLPRYSIYLLTSFTLKSGFFLLRETDFTTFETGFQGWEARNWGKVEYSRNTTPAISNNITSNSNNNVRPAAPVVPAPPKLENLNDTNEVGDVIKG